MIVYSNILPSFEVYSDSNLISLLVVFFIVIVKFSTIKGLNLIYCFPSR